MAIDQREALIEAIRKQVEKERAEKAAKLKKEQESMMFAKGGAAVKEKKESSKQKFKTLSAEDLARIEEKKRKKRAEAMGMTLEEYERNMNAPLEPEPAPEEKEAAEEAEMMSKIAEKAKADAKAKAEEEAKGGIGLKTKLDGGLGQYKESGDGLGKIGGGGLNADIDVKVVDDSNNKFSSDGTRTISGNKSGWVASEDGTRKKEELESILPENRTTPTSDVNTMYDIDDEDTQFEDQLKSNNYEAAFDNKTVEDIIPDEPKKKAEEKKDDKISAADAAAEAAKKATSGIERAEA